MKWNKEDSFLYRYFNKTFWKKIDDQDESFWKDVKTLKNMVANTEQECVEPNEKVFENYKTGLSLYC